MIPQLALLPLYLAFALFVAIGVNDGGYPVTVWYPAALFLLGLLAVSVLVRRDSVRSLSRGGRLSLLFLAGLTGWTYVSIAWSDVKGDAWDGANRGLLYFIVYALFLIAAPSAASAAAAIGAYAVAIAFAGVVVLAQASRSPNPDEFFLIARFSEPAGYQNANCALFAIALWPALFLASRRSVPVLLRGLLLATAGVLLELGLLSQSRGWLIAVPLVFLLYIALVPGRVRSLVFAVPVAVAFVAARSRLLDVYPALRSGEDIHASLAAARGAIAVTAVALFVTGLLLALADRWLSREDALVRRLKIAGAAIFTAIGAVAAVAGLLWLGNPVTRAEQAWDDFGGEASSSSKASYLTSGFSSNRYDLWRVALREIARQPIQGVGSDNFAVDYVRERRSHEEPLYAHSIELKIVAQTGIVGGVLFLGFLAANVTVWIRRWARGSRFSRGLRAVCMVAFAYWLVHGSIDWFWELPGLAAPAFAFLALSVSIDRLPRRGPAGNPRVARAAATVGLGAVVAAVVSLAAPWLAAKEVQAALHQWQDRPAESLDRLERARRLNPLSDQPDVLAGVIASKHGDTRRMAEAFRRALERNPYNWYAHLELGVAYAGLGRRGDALRELARAARLNPREPTIPLVTGRVRGKMPVSTEDLDRTFLERIQVSNRNPA